MIKIVSYNIHKGFNASNRNFVLPDIKRALSEINADIICLQEVIGENTKHQKNIAKWPKENAQHLYLADQTSHHAYGKNAVYLAGHHGNATISSYPIEFFCNIDLTVSRFEQRGLLHSIISIKEKKVHVLNTHLNLMAGSRRQQIKHIIRYLEAHIPNDAPVIIAGDFNDWLLHAQEFLTSENSFLEAYQHLNQKHAATFPSIFPMLAMDRIYVKGFRIESAEVLNFAPWKDLSDHLPVVAQIILER